jgi:glycosyltransferase involved in cell wall biosynthesis
VPQGDSAALGARLRELVDRPDLAAAMGARARAAVLERFTWEPTAQRCLAAYGRALGPFDSAQGRRAS